MEHFCFFCGHPMVQTGTKTEIRNGKVRELTEFTCTNPTCRNRKVLDRPYEG